jgi:hypothetical protein
MSHRNVLFTAIALATLVAATANAETLTENQDGTAPKLQLKPNAKSRLLTHALALPAYFFWMSTEHEGSHALMAEITGVGVKAFKPYPHTADINGERKFVFGAVDYARAPTHRQNELVTFAPSITDLTVFTATDLTLSYAVSPDSALAPVLLIAGMICPWADAFTNYNGWTKTNDISLMAQMTGTPRWAWQVTGDAFLAVGAWRILHHAHEMLFETPSVKNRSNVAFMPMVNGSLGVTAVGRF